MKIVIAGVFSLVISCSALGVMISPGLKPDADTFASTVSRGLNLDGNVHGYELQLKTALLDLTKDVYRGEDIYGAHPYGRWQNETTFLPTCDAAAETLHMELTSSHSYQLKADGFDLAEAVDDFIVVDHDAGVTVRFDNNLLNGD